MHPSNRLPDDAEAVAPRYFVLPDGYHRSRLTRALSFLIQCLLRRRDLAPCYLHESATAAFCWLALRVAPPAECSPRMPTAAGFAGARRRAARLEMVPRGQIRR